MSNASVRLKPEWLVDSNLDGGCVGSEWRTQVWDPEWKPGRPRCLANASLHHCPSPSFKDEEATIVNHPKMYCDEHWAEHLEREETWNTKYGTNVAVAFPDDDSEPWCMEHPDAIYTKPLTNEFLLSPIINVIVLAVVAVTVVGGGFFLWNLFN